MARPQLENGFARIANELLEQFLVRDFGKRELVILLYVVRQTYGFNRKAFALVPQEAAEVTGLDAHNLRASIRSLVAARVLVASEGGIGIQKDHEAWQVAAREGVKITRVDGASRGQNYPQNGSKLPAKRVKITPDTPFQVSVSALVQEPKDRKTKDNTPLPPTGGEVERVPFTEDLPTQDEIDHDSVLEEENRPLSVSLRAAGPDFSRPVTAAPKPARMTVKALLESDPRFAAFRAEWPKRKDGRYNDRPADLVSYWVKYEVAESPRYEQAMEALRRKKQAPDWTRTDKDCIPAPAAWLNGKPWEAIEAEGWEPAGVVANPYENKPWGPIWTQAGFPATEVGVMNFCAAVAAEGDPYEARRLFQTAGFEAAVIYAFERRSAG